MSWEDNHLATILAGETPVLRTNQHSSSYYNEHGQPLWHGKLASIDTEICCVLFDEFRHLFFEITIVWFLTLVITDNGYHIVCLFFHSTESVPVACSRVDALRSHGYTSEALRLAVAVVRTLKQAQREAYLWWGSKREEMLPRCSASRACRSLGPGALEGWVGHPLDPITCLFDTLAEASLLPEDLPRFQYHSGEFLCNFW